MSSEASFGAITINKIIYAVHNILGIDRNFNDSFDVIGSPRSRQSTQARASFRLGAGVRFSGEDSSLNNKLSSPIC